MITTYHMAKAYNWLLDHNAKPETNPTRLAEWYKKADDYADWRWAAVTEDGKVVGEASQRPNSDDCHLTPQTAKKYGLPKNQAADEGLEVIEKATGKPVKWAKEQDMLFSPLTIQDTDRYKAAKAKYSF